MSQTQRNKSVLGTILVAAILALTACGGNDKEAEAKSSEEPSSQESETNEQGPDLTGIPDVVAEVNGEEVTKDEFVAIYEAQFQQAAQEAQMGGTEPDEDALKKLTADNLVDTELLTQEADDRGISATDKDVDDELDGLAKENQLASGKELLAALEKQGTSEELVRSQVETQLVVERLVADEAGDVEPTNGELRKIYDEAVQQQKQAGEQGGQQAKIPPFAKVRPQLVEQAKAENEGKVAQALVDELRKDAEITISL